ncbi:MAG TPA: hypothetical protein VFS30_07795 [Dehalococcoidia bacterium]|nr:hypothetical protein [Dehalococcoidia bacterium]
MRRFCPPRLYSLLAAAVMATATLGCGALDGSPSPTETPNPAQSLGLEIAETYGSLMLHTRLIVESRPAVPDVKERLRALREEFKLQFGSYACLRDTLIDAEQTEVATTFDAGRSRSLESDMSWLEDAASDYDLEDPAIRERLEDIQTLDDYAFRERVAQSRPGEELLCGG